MVLHTIKLENGNDGITWATKNPIGTGPTKRGSMIDPDLNHTIDHIHNPNEVLVFRDFSLNVRKDKLRVIEGRLVIIRDVSAIERERVGNTQPPAKTNAFQNICELLKCTCTIKKFKPLLPNEGSDNWQEPITVGKTEKMTAATVGFGAVAPTCSIEVVANLLTHRSREEVGRGIKGDKGGFGGATGMATAFSLATEDTFVGSKGLSNADVIFEVAVEVHEKIIASIEGGKVRLPGISNVSSTITWEDISPSDLPSKWDAVTVRTPSLTKRDCLDSAWEWEDEPKDKATALASSRVFPLSCTGAEGSRHGAEADRAPTSRAKPTDLMLGSMSAWNSTGIVLHFSLKTKEKFEQTEAELSEIWLLQILCLNLYSSFLNS
ncbi:hypothetical protein DFH29DRAFT_873468 [Suillus ampliporus]|nr:hypothetical protein DFH29DRAFT_873468 [Suillus ampliporus]